MKNKSVRNLTKRQEKFIEAINDPQVKSNTEAAIIAGYPENSARITASQLLTNPNIHARIEKRKAEMAQYANVHAELVFGGTALRATASIDDALDDRGRFDIDKARETGVIHQIKRIVRTPNKYGESVSIELYGKDSAQDKLGQYLGLEQMPRENAETVSAALETFSQWLEFNPEATQDERSRAIKDFAALGKVDEKVLRDRAGVIESSEAVN